MVFEFIGIFSQALFWCRWYQKVYFLGHPDFRVPLHVSLGDGHKVLEVVEHQTVSKEHP